MKLYIVTSHASDGTWIGGYTDVVIVWAEDEHHAKDIALQETHIIGGREDLTVESAHGNVIFQNYTRD